MVNAIRAAIMGAAGLGAAGAGFLGLQSVNGPGSEEAPASAAEEALVRAAPASSDTELCLTGDISFLPGDQKGCFTRAEIAAWARDPLTEPGAGKLQVMMSHPSDATRDAVACDTCRKYAEYRYDGWFAMTSRDMRREAFFRRACGVIDMLASAAPAEVDHFEAGGLTDGEAASIAAGQILKFGTGDLSSPGDPQIEKLASSSWRIAAGGGTVFLEEIAVLDFDADGVGEMLAFFAAGPERATARIADVALIEKDSADAAAAITPIDFTARQAGG